MDTLKNIPLPITGYDKNSKTFKVVYQSKEYDVRQTGHEIPKELLCRVVQHGDDVEITQEIDNIIHAGAMRRFSVKNDLRDSAGVYELVDEDGLAVYLYGAEEYKFFKGKTLLCNVISTDGVRPYVVLKDKLVNSGSAFSISKEYFMGLFPEKEWDVEGLVDLILYDGMEDPFEVKCYEWVMAQTTKDVEAKTTDVRECCLKVLEESELLNKCSVDEVYILRERISLLIEHMGYVKTAKDTIDDHQENQYIEELFSKLRTSGFVYHPTKRFCITTYLFKMKQELMVEKMEELMDIIRGRDISHWKIEPFRTELIKQLENYIRVIDSMASKDPDRNDKFLKGFQALAIQLLLAGNEEELIDVQLNRSMLYRYASHVKYANTERLANASLNSLLDLFKKNVTYGLVDTGTPDKLMNHLDNWSRNQEIDKSKKAVYRAKNLCLTITDGKMCIMPETSDALKTAIDDNVKLWMDIDVMLEKKRVGSPQRPGNAAILKYQEKLWKHIEKELFDTTRKVEKPKVVVKTVPDVGESVLAYIYKQDADNPNLFYCRIADEEKGFVGEGKIYVQSDDYQAGMVTYFFNPDLECFKSDSGAPWLLEMNVIDKNDDGICIMGMKELLQDFIEECGAEFLLDCVVVKLLSENTCFAVSNDGASVYVTYDPMEVFLVEGEHIEVSRKEKQWWQNRFLQGFYYGKSSSTFTARDAFANLMYSYSTQEYKEECVEERHNEIMLDRSHVLELLNILDEVASTEKTSEAAFNYMGFALMLSIMIGAEERERCYRGQMELAKMLYDFAYTNDVDNEKLAKLQEVNKDLLNSNFNLRYQFNRLLAVSYLGERNNEWLVRMANEDPDEKQRKLASLIYSYNVLNESKLGVDDIKAKIKEELNLKDSPNIKVYEYSEGEAVEFKTSIVYPPNSNMRPNIEKQTKNILKEVCAFLNRSGGILYLGVNDAGGGVGLEEDMKYELFKNSRDRYDNYVRSQISIQLGQYANHCVDGYFDTDTYGRDIYVLKIKPCPEAVSLEGKYYERQGSSAMQVGKDYLETFLKNRKAEYEAIMKGQGEIAKAENVSELNLISELQDGQKQSLQSERQSQQELASADNSGHSVHRILTSSLRSNVLHDYESKFEYVEAYIHLLDNYKYKVEERDTYEEESSMLTLALHPDECKGNLLLVYENGKVAKVPMSVILDKEKAKIYNRFNGASVMFASPASDDDVLFQIYEYKEQFYHRYQEIGTIPESKMGDDGELLFSVDFDRVRMSEVIGPSHKPHLPKMTTDKRKIGNNCSRGESVRSLEYLEQIGLKIKI